MAKRWGWLTPNSPAPDELRCRSISVPDDVDLVAAVSGALLDLTKPYNWEQFGTMTPDQAAEIMLYAVQEFMNDECGSGGSCRRIYRNGVGGVAQQSDDGGETWEATTGSAAVPNVPERDNPTAYERRCLASANAANVLAQTYEAWIDAWNFDTSIDYGAAVFAATIAGLIGSWIGIIAVSSINLMLGVFGAAYEALNALLADAWDASFNEEMKCLLLSVSEDNAGVVTFKYDEFISKIYTLDGDGSDVERVLLSQQIGFMMLWIGGDGLNLAGATTAITEADCDSCGDWCWNSDVFSDLQTGWDVYIKGNWQIDHWNGVNSNAGSSGTNFNNSVGLERSFAPTEITSISLSLNLEKVSAAAGCDVFIYDELGGAHAIYSSINSCGSPIYVTWTGSLVMSAICVWVNGGRGASPGTLPATSIAQINAIEIRGRGDNPFGSSNC